GQVGSSVIRIYVTDTGARSNSTSFLVTVLPSNTTPVISNLPPANTIANTPTGPIDFTIYDLETPSASLAVSGTSANQTLLPNANIMSGGSGSNRTVTLTPASGQVGATPVTVSVSDGTNSASSTFPLMVTPSANVIFYEPFSYADGSLLTNSAFLWG